MLRLAMTVLCALLAFGAFSVQVQAVDVAIHGMSPDKLEGKCGEAGGVYSSDEYGYGCTMANCDGKGGSCGISCAKDDNSCTGSTPDVIKGRVTIYGFLHDGDNVVHDGPGMAPPNFNSRSAPSQAPASRPIILY